MNAPAEVCLVDDDLSVLRSMKYLLASDGVPVRAFEKSAEFLTYATTNPISVVANDIWMAGLTGLQILGRMAALAPRPQGLTITPRDDPAARATAMAIGPAAFFIKPFDDEQFLSAVHHALAQAAESEPNIT